MNSQLDKPNVTSLMQRLRGRKIIDAARGMTRGPTEDEAEAADVIDALRAELAAVAVAVGRSKDGTGLDVDWFELHKDVSAKSPSSLACQDSMRKALEKIERWFGEFPPTGKTWDDGSPMSYGVCYGSNGERDFMRGIAREALSAKAPAATTKPQCVYRTGCETPNDCRERGYCRSPKNAAPLVGSSHNDGQHGLSSMPEPAVAALTSSASGRWERCTPELLERFPDGCTTLPRRPGDGTYSHDHFVPPTTTRAEKYEDPLWLAQCLERRFRTDTTIEPPTTTEKVEIAAAKMLRKLASSARTRAEFANVYLVEGKPHRLCDCDPRKEHCARGAKRTLATTEFSRCLIPV